MQALPGDVEGWAAVAASNMGAKSRCLMTIAPATEEGMAGQAGQIAEHKLGRLWVTRANDKAARGREERCGTQVEAADIMAGSGSPGGPFLQREDGGVPGQAALAGEGEFRSGPEEVNGGTSAWKHLSIGAASLIVDTLPGSGHEAGQVQVRLSEVVLPEGMAHGWISR